MVVGGAVLLVLAGGAVAADRVAVGVAERRAVTEVGADARVVGTPEVHINGFPFLTQLLGRSLSDVSGSVDGLTLTDLDLTDVTVEAHGVALAAPVTAAEVDVVGTVPVGSLEQLVRDQLGLEVTLTAVNGELVVAGQVIGLPVAAHLVPRVEAGAIRVDVSAVELDGLTIDQEMLPGDLAARLGALSIPVDGLPAGLALTGASVVDDGVRLTAAGTDVVVDAALGGR
ncbi:hypothetical protein AGMMS50218_04940 [Actinomycetota bacterium]|nr:hypothetical protein AGMMS50218_04940 [Actinomycetota bacterium]